MERHLDPDVWMDLSAGRYFTCDERLRIADDDPGDTRPPPGWAKAQQALEEPMETLVVLNLQKLLGDDVSFLFRAGDYWGLQDITGLDALGRIHLMELKKDKIDNKVTQQLGAYLLRTMFDGRANFVRRMAEHNKRGFTDSRWAVYLAGALANVRTTTVGPKDYYALISALGRGPALSDSQWKNQGEVERQARQVTTLMAMVAERGQATLSNASFDAWGREVLSMTRPEVPPSLPLRVRSPGVIWLIGRRIDEAALHQIRLWRRSGVDARPLCVDARQSTDTGRWMVRLLTEHFPERQALVRQVATGIGTLTEPLFHEDQDRPIGYELRLSLYGRPPASSRDLNAGGEPLHDGARAYLYGPTVEEPVAVWAPSGRVR